MLDNIKNSFLLINLGLRYLWRDKRIFLYFILFNILIIGIVFVFGYFFYLLNGIKILEADNLTSIFDISNFVHAHFFIYIFILIIFITPLFFEISVADLILFKKDTFSSIKNFIKRIKLINKSVYFNILVGLKSILKIISNISPSVFESNIQDKIDQLSGEKSKTSDSEMPYYFLTILSLNNDNSLEDNVRKSKELINKNFPQIQRNYDTGFIKLIFFIAIVLLLHYSKYISSYYDLIASIAILFFFFHLIDFTIIPFKIAAFKYCNDEEIPEPYSKEIITKILK